MDSLKQHNDGYRYMLVCIDVLSRLIYVAEAESKKSEHMIEAFEKVFKKAGVLPNKMYSDSGLEFQAKRMNEYWRSKDIIKHVMYSPHLHAGVVERANLNRTTGMRPVDVNFRNATELRNRLYKDVEEHERQPKFKIELDSNWSVALSSIIYPNSFPSVGVDEDDFVNIKLLNPDYKSAGTDPTTVTLKDAELTRETSSAAPLDIELQRETEPKTSDKELGRETRPPQLSDKQLYELEHEKPQKEQFRPPLIVEHSKTSTIEQERLDLAKRVTEQSWKDTDSSAATAADIAEKAKTALNRAEQARRQAPNAPHAKKLFDNLSNMENNLRKLAEKISHDIAPEDKLGVNELANRVVTAVDDFLNAKVKTPRAPEDPKFPAGQPKQHQEKQLEKMKPTVEKELESRTKPLVSKISDKKELKREPEKATVEKELEREPIKAPEKELERESPKKRTKKKAKNEIDEKMQEEIQTDSYIQKGLEKEIPEEPQKELERERNQQEKTETEFPSFEYEIGDSSEKQREPLEEQVDESYLSKKKEEKLDKEKIQIAENIAHEFPSTDYGTEDSENEKTEKWSPELTKQKVMKGKEDSLEQPARQKNEEATLVKSTDKKEEEEFPSTEYEIEEDNNVLSSSSSSSSSSIVAENKPSETAKTDEGSSLMPQIDEIAETGDGGQKSGTMLPVDFPSYNDEDNMNNVVLRNELSEETLISATPEDELNKSEHNDEDDLPDLPSPQALSTAKQRGEKKEATVVSERKKMLIGHQKQQRKAVEFLFNEITQRFYISIATQQEGKGEQQYFVGTRYQRGGGLLQNVARFLMPVASNLLSSASKEGIAAGTRVLGDLSQGKALKESLETHAKQGFENLAGKLHQCGKGGIYGRNSGRGRRSVKAINKTSVREVLPLSALNQTGPYLFRLFSDSQYCDLSKTYMYLLTSIERKNAAGEWVPTDDTIEEDRHELGYSHEIRKAFHEAGCYYSDENSQDSYANKGFTSRVQRFSNGKHCETMVKLNLIWHAKTPFCSTIRISCSQSIGTAIPSFCLLQDGKPVIDAVKDAQGNIITAARVTWHDSKAEYRIRLHDMRLYVRTVDVTSSLNVAISRQLESTPAKYALRKVEMRSIFLGTGRTELSHNVFTSTLPRRLICRSCLRTHIQAPGICRHSILSTLMYVQSAPKQMD
ncbi:hypothetical protein niasHT_011955 [Heterodera trifolii]|uniref:Integrase catalytic domain-containing protein n=1 Tax=Heterodera trifolii TaxID=157864 RepID=A0ABD2LK49_9BILA